MPSFDLTADYHAASADSAITSPTGSHRSAGIDCARTLRDLAGTWKLSQSASSNRSAPLATQRSFAFSQSPVVMLHVTQSEFPSRLLLRQITTSPEGTFTATECWTPPPRSGTWSEWVQGASHAGEEWQGRCRWVKGSEFEHKEGIGYVTDGLSRLGEFLELEVESDRGGWRNLQVLSMHEGRLVRKVVGFGKDGRRDEAAFVWEFEGR